MSIKKGEISMSDLKRQNIPIDELEFLNLFKYRFLITDWSGIFIEFALIFKRKAFLINTTKKMRNKNYLNFENKPIEISLRNVLAKTYDIKNIQNIVKEIKASKNEIKEDENLKKIPCFGKPLPIFCVKSIMQKILWGRNIECNQ